MLSENLASVSYIFFLSDASNHNEIKLYPILVRYFDIKNGIQIKILNLESIEGKTSDILSKSVISSYNRLEYENFGALGW